MLKNMVIAILAFTTISFSAVSVSTGMLTYDPFGNFTPAGVNISISPYRLIKTGNSSFKIGIGADCESQLIFGGWYDIVLIEKITPMILLDIKAGTIHFMGEIGPSGGIIAILADYRRGMGYIYGFTAGPVIQFPHLLNLSLKLGYSMIPSWNDNMWNISLNFGMRFPRK
jgi:hypothetical protein